MRHTDVQNELILAAENAEDALNTLRIARKKDARPLLDQATRLVQDVEGLYLNLSNQEAKLMWKMRVEELVRELQMATTCVLSADGTPSPAGVPPPSAALAPAGPPPEPQEVVGDIDDLFSGLVLNIPGEGAGPSAGPAPQGVPGRRYVKVARSPAGGPRPLARRPSGTPTGYDAVGQGELASAGKTGATEPEQDEEAARYPTKPLRVELPILPAVAAAAAAASQHHEEDSQGSAGSTMAQGRAREGGNGGGNSDSDDDSITSPDVLDDVPGFK